MLCSLLYRYLTFVLSPCIALYLRYRLYKGKEDLKRFPERFGESVMPRPEGKLLWIHAASVGEALSILPLIKQMASYAVDWRILLTTGTVSSARLMAERLPDTILHQFVPIDTPQAVKRFLHHWHPNLALWTESEFWPNLIMETYRYCPLLLINARISDRSFQTWQRYSGLCRYLLSCFTLCFPQSQQDEQRLRILGAKHIHFIGNLKCDAPALPGDPEKIALLRTLTDNRPLWLAASTHAREEKMIADAHHHLKQQFPNLLTIIAPRHPHRRDEILKDLSPFHFSIACRSKEGPITPQTDIYLADTLGELGIFYRIAPIVFMGGTLIPHGGQNPLEAARLQCAILAGPSMENFKEIATEMIERNALLQVKDTSELQEILSGLLASPDQQTLLAAQALTFATEKSGIIKNYIQEIFRIVEQPISS